MESLYTRASIVVLPSHVEGFGMGLIHALAAGKVVVARDIPATREILATYKRYSGLFLYAHDGELAQTLRMAMNETHSRVEDDGAEGWGEWTDGFAEFCSTLIEKDDLFGRLTSRIRAGDLLRAAELANRLQAPAPTRPAEPSQIAAGKQTPGGERVFTDDHGRSWLPMRHVKQLLSRDGEEFVYGSYVSVLNRLPDPEGLVNYLTELQSGVGKLEILTRLRNSSEGRQSRMPLSGYRRALLRQNLVTLLQRRARGAENGR